MKEDKRDFRRLFQLTEKKQTWETKLRIARGVKDKEGVKLCNKRLRALKAAIAQEEKRLEAIVAQ